MKTRIEKQLPRPRAVALCLTTVAFALCANAQPTITAFDPLGSQATVPYAINDAGVITGVYSDANAAGHGFVRSEVSPFEIVSFDAASGSRLTVPTSINSAGAITGPYLDAHNIQRGFVRAATSPFAVTSFDVPGSIATNPTGINDAGTITGWYLDATGRAHGFVRAAASPFDITSFDPAGSTFTIPVSINAAGTITGRYDTPGGTLGFVREAASPFAITSFAPEGSPYTTPASINTTGVVVGSFWGADNFFRGFVRTPASPFTITAFDAAVGSSFILVSSVNAGGAIAGYYADANSFQHGFVRDGTSPFAITSFDPAGSVATAVVGMNTAGMITGYFEDENGRHGFVRSSGPAIVAPAAIGQCQGQGWKTLFRPNGSSFKNQGECIKFVNGGKWNTPLSPKPFGPCSAIEIWRILWLNAGTSNRRRIVKLTRLLPLAVLAISSAVAHHSFDAEFDRNKPITLKGTVTKIEFMNPHIWIYMDVKDEKGVVTAWQVEGGAPNAARRNGWSANSVQKGAEITVDGTMSKDGSKTVNARTVMTADGKRLFAGSSEGDAKAK